MRITYLSNSHTEDLQMQPQADRKRRDNLNDRIGDLLELIPEPFFKDTTEKNSGTKDGRPNKGQVLSKSVDYIIWLQEEIDNRNRKEVELLLKLGREGPTTAETLLANIGVGPLADEE